MRPGALRLYSSRVAKNAELENFFFEGFHQLKTNAWGIPEPQDGNTVESSLIDTVIVPLLAVDKKGNRVGYGKGFYDKFLAQCKPTCKRIGLSFFRPVDAIGDLHPFDVPLTHLVVPDEVISF